MMSSEKPIKRSIYKTITIAMLFIFLTGILVRASIGTYMLQNMAEEIVGEQLTSSVALVSDEVDRALTLR